jgi:hypothetical protein
MAKVRLQAGNTSLSGLEDSSSESESDISDIKGAEEGSLTASYAEVTKSGHNITQFSKPPKKASRPQKSAIKLLAKVLREDGLLGWYQVCRIKVTAILFAYHGILFREWVLK